MDMVGHQDIGMDVTVVFLGRLFERVEIFLVILYFKERLLAIISALYDM